MSDPFQNFIDTMEIDGEFIPLTRPSIEDEIVDWRAKNLPKKKPIRKTTYWEWAVKQVMNGGKCHNYGLRPCYLRRIERGTP